jgi:hypothetical protein
VEPADQLARGGGEATVRLRLDAGLGFADRLLAPALELGPHGALESHARDDVSGVLVRSRQRRHRLRRHRARCEEGDEQPLHQAQDWRDSSRGHRPGQAGGMSRRKTRLDGRTPLKHIAAPRFQEIKR